MEKATRYTLGKNERLKSRKAIEQLFAGGKSFSLFPFKIIWRQSAMADAAPEKESLQAAFSVSKRYFKKATARNRIKRLMREAYRLQKSGLQQSLAEKRLAAALFILFVGNEIPEYTIVFNKMNAALKKLQRLVHEETAANS